MSDETLTAIVEAAAQRGAEAALRARDAERQSAARSLYAGFKQHVVMPALAWCDRVMGVAKEPKS